MELRHLRHFVAVAEELHFARAAERLGMEQSPLSHSIRNLETELGTKLFQRTTRRTWLTRAGTRFLADARRILAEVEAAAVLLRAENEDSPERVRLVLGEDLAGEPFTRLLFELEHHRPPIAVDVRELAHGEAARLVRDGGADLALTLDGRERGGLMQVRGWANPVRRRTRMAATPVALSKSPAASVIAVPRRAISSRLRRRLAFFGAANFR